jgi:histidinol-phosphate/aromatic aminotransferase/cobyric acid decarboxylase-like protein
LVEHLLAQHRIMTKDVSTRIADGGTWLRLAVRLPQENRLLVEALAELSR